MKRINLSEKPLVSAVITTHNRIGLLKRAIESVKSQSYPNLEIIVVDDKSEDGTKEYCQKDSDIKYIYIPPEESKGGNHARNVGIQNSKGEYIAFLDDDDYWLKDKIFKQVELISSKNCDCVYGRMIMEIVNEGEIKHITTVGNPFYQGDVSQKILVHPFTLTSLLLIKRELLFKIGLFDESLTVWQDYELMIRLTQLTNVYYVDEPLIKYRINCNDGNRLTNKYHSWLKTVKYIRKKHKELYQKLPLSYKLMSYTLIAEDGRRRCKVAGLKGRYLLFTFLFKIGYIHRCFIEGTIKSKIINKFSSHGKKV